MEIFNTAGVEYKSLTPQSLKNVLTSFSVLKPDLRYLRNMSFIAAMFLVYQTEVEAFRSFTNFVHSHHFLPFFRGSGADIKLRIDYFDK